MVGFRGWGPGGRGPGGWGPRGLDGGGVQGVVVYRGPEVGV